MTNQHRKKAFELACQISFEADPEKKKHLVRAWHLALKDYWDAVAIARGANV